jgi:hypothetical protein
VIKFVRELKFLKSRVEKYHNPLVLAERKGGLWVMVLKATFNNISAITWQSVLLVEKTRVPGENNRLVAIH